MTTLVFAASAAVLVAFFGVVLYAMFQDIGARGVAFVIVATAAMLAAVSGFSWSLNALVGGGS